MRIGVAYLGRRGPGGPISFQLAQHLSKKADIFCVISENADGLREWNDSGLALITTPTFRSKAEAFATYVGSAKAQQLARAIRERNPDVMLYPMVHPWTPRLQHLLAPIPDVVVVHDPIPHPGFIHSLSSLWERRSARNATRCVVLGRIFVEELVKQGVRSDRIDVIPHGILDQYVDSQKVGQNTGPTTILFFGRITEYKGLNVLLDAFRRLVTIRPDVQLQIVGDGSLRPYQYGLENTPNLIIVNRWIDDSEIATYFNRASILVVPYTSASQSGVIATAAAFSMPVVATRVGALPEQIEDRQTGLLIEPGSADQLFAAMNSLLDEPEFARSLGHNLQKRTSKTANWDDIATMFKETCRKAVTSG